MRHCGIIQVGVRLAIVQDAINEVPDFVAEGIPCWCYYACVPRGRYLNRFLDTPLPKIRMRSSSRLR